MGWTSYNMTQPIKEWFKEQWESSNKYIVLESALVKRSTMYGAIKNIETGDVFCAVFLIRWSKGYYNFSYKDMTEFAGPNECECPEKVFKKLTPLDDMKDIGESSKEWASNWRKNVQDLHNNRKKLKSGKFVIKTKNPVSFTNGQSYQYFKKEGQRYYAGVIEPDNTFDKYLRVRFNPLKCEYELVGIN